MPRRKIRAHYEHISEFETGRAIGLKEAGWSNRLIARHLCRSDAAIRRCWQKWVNNGSMQRQDGSGRPRAATEWEDRAIVRMAVAAPESTLSTIQRVTGTQVSKMTINRRQRERNLRARRPLRCLPLTPVHRQVRLQWCRERTTWNCADWERIVFSDESVSYCVMTTVASVSGDVLGSVWILSLLPPYNLNSEATGKYTEAVATVLRAAPIGTRNQAIKIYDHIQHLLHNLSPRISTLHPRLRDVIVVKSSRHWLLSLPLVSPRASALGGNTSPRTIKVTDEEPKGHQKIKGLSGVLKMTDRSASTAGALATLHVIAETDAKLSWMPDLEEKKSQFWKTENGKLHHGRIRKRTILRKIQKPVDIPQLRKIPSLQKNLTIPCSPSQPLTQSPQ
ncbi:hypothetical protein LAZ67_6003530 [Cordylochernes scorpioides]|uniref:Transposase Tc1-like domain-containing protein n=1 Tax=Cordylochernes scorpioides TaxID=51811 RepID=A0ABY6KQP4_9ARAC|nr:hypothetical protein LAZ67_6003530 [Cordylochernes scorpioides]